MLVFLGRDMTIGPNFLSFPSLLLDVMLYQAIKRVLRRRSWNRMENVEAGHVWEQICSSPRSNHRSHPGCFDHIFEDPGDSSEPAVECAIGWKQRVSWERRKGRCARSANQWIINHA